MDARPVLDGLRVLDLTRNLAGPMCTMLLGDLGADVVKIEHPSGGDDTRQWLPPAWNGRSATFLAANRNKRSMAVDLDTPEGRSLVLRLAAGADVVVESFKPGSLDKRGLGFETVRATNKRVVWCSISAYGNTGPWRDVAGYDPVLQAKTGIMSLTGEPDRSPVRLGIGAIDLGTAMWSAVGILAALRERDTTGLGGLVEASLYETSTWWLSYFITGYLAGGDVPNRQGTRTAFIAPYEVFPTADGEIMIAAANNTLFRSLVGALGLAALLDDPRFSTNADRVAHREQLRARIVLALESDTATAWEQRLNAASVPCSRVRTVDELLNDEQLSALGLLTEVAHPDIADLRLVDMPIRRNGRRAERLRRPPELGEHTNEILAELQE